MRELAYSGTLDTQQAEVVAGPAAAVTHCGSGGPPFRQTGGFMCGRLLPCSRAEELPQLRDFCFHGVRRRNSPSRDAMIIKAVCDGRDSSIDSCPDTLNKSHDGPIEPHGGCEDVEPPLRQVIGFACRCDVLPESV